MKMKTYIALIILLPSIVACTQAPELKVYTLDVPTVPIAKNTQYRYTTLKVIFPQSIREEMSEKMNFSYSNDERGVYQNSQWSNTMSKLLEGTLIDMLDKSKLFKAVLSDTSTLQENYRLESNIFAFEHKVRGTQSHAVISIQFTLINAKTGKLIKSKRFNYREKTESTDAKGYVNATNIAISKLGRDLIYWIQ
ncbi:MAG TPA: hypothetical protein ENK90_00290 [Epsilonproteobacteria bacterium]|nr:hypothetical protein [Campylobacterota bacterium]HHE05544.1 hypothetical protein [Campylobacterota bacterium]